MEDHAISIRDAIDKTSELRELTGATDIVVCWLTEFGDVTLIVDDDGYELFVGDEPVPMKEQ